MIKRLKWSFIAETIIDILYLNMISALIVIVLPTIPEFTKSDLIWYVIVIELMFYFVLLPYSWAMGAV